MTNKIKVGDLFNLKCTEENIVRVIGINPSVYLGNNIKYIYLDNGDTYMSGEEAFLKYFEKIEYPPVEKDCSSGYLNEKKESINQDIVNLLKLYSFKSAYLTDCTGKEFHISVEEVQ